jgi:hypothetical protein
MIAWDDLVQLLNELGLPQAGPADRVRIVRSVLVATIGDLGRRLAEHDGQLANELVSAMGGWISSPDPARVQDLIDDAKAAIFKAAKHDEDTDFLRLVLQAAEVVKVGRLIEWQFFIRGLTRCYAHAALDDGADNEQADEVANDTAAALLEHAVRHVENPGVVVKSRVVSVGRYADRGGSGSIATVTVSGFSRPVFVVFYSQVAKGHRAVGPRVFTLSDRGKPKSVSERVAQIALHALSSAGRTRTRR